MAGQILYGEGSVGCRLKAKGIYTSDQKILSLSEVLWPCMLFLILAAVRFQEPPKHKEHCYLEARDLPNRGLYPFVRSLFCNVGSRCKNSSYSTPKNNSSQYNLSLWNVMWDPYAVKIELESRFGFSELHAKKLLNYMAVLNKIPTEDTLEHFVCSSLSNMSEVGADSRDNEGDCIPAWLEAKLYLVHSVNKIKLYTQIFQQWFGSSKFQKILSKLGGNIVDLVSQYSSNSEALETASKNPHSFVYSILHVEKLQTLTENLPQWPVMKRLILVDGAMRNIVTQNLYFTKGKNILWLLVASSQMTTLMSNASYICEDLLTVFEKALHLPPNSEVIDVLARFVCHYNNSNEVLLLQKVIHGQQSLPDSIMEEFLGWQEIEQQLAENSASYCKINQLLSTKAPSGEDVYFSSCQEQLLLSLVIRTLEEIWFGFEENPHWKDVTTVVRTMCGIAQFVNEAKGFRRGQSGEKQSLCISWFSVYFSGQKFPEILTSVKELLTSEENLQIPEEKEDIVNSLRLAEFIQENLMPGSLASLSLQDTQSLLDTVLNNAVTWINSFASVETNESAVDFHPFSDLSKKLLENFQLVSRLWPNKQAEVFWKTVEMVLYELDPKLPHLLMGTSSTGEVDNLENFLSKTVFSVPENQKVLNKSLQFFQNIRAHWPQWNVDGIKVVNNFCENFITSLYEVGLLTQEHVSTALSIMYKMRNLSCILLSNATAVSKVQDTGKIVSDFYQNIPRIVDSKAASLVEMLSTVYQNTDQFLRIQSNSSLLSFFHKTSKDISSTRIQLAFQNMSVVFDFLSEIITLLDGLTQKPLCEKLERVYNYLILQAQYLAQKGEQEVEVVYKTLGSLKAMFIEKELRTVAFQYLEQLFDIPPESLLNNECTDFYVLGIPSEKPSVKLYSSLLLPLVSVLSNSTDFGVSVPFAMHCTATWLQMWTKILQEASEMLTLDLNFITYLQNSLTQISEGLGNITHAEPCNVTFVASPETTSALNLLGIITGAGKLNNWEDFGALDDLVSALKIAIDITSNLTRESLEEAFQTMETVITELQKSLLKTFSREFLDFWAGIFTRLSSKVDYKKTNLYSIGHSLSSILKLSTEELAIVLTELKETAGFLKNISQDRYLLACANILQNVTELDLTTKNISQIPFWFHPDYLLTIGNILNGVKGCNEWIDIISNLSEKLISLSNLENTSHVLFLLSLGNLDDMDYSLENILDIINMAYFDLEDSLCLQNGSDAHCMNIYFNIIENILKFTQPTSDVKGDTHTLDFIFKLLNSSGGQIETIVKHLMKYSQYTSDLKQTYFTKLITEATENSSEVPNFFHSHQPSSVAHWKRIWIFLKNRTAASLRNSTSLLDIVQLLNSLEAIPQDKNISLLMESFEQLITYVASNLSHNMQSMQNIPLQMLINAAAVDVELVGKTLKFLKSFSIFNFPIILGDNKFLKHVANLMQNLENTDLEFLINQLEQVCKSLNKFFTNIKALKVENPVLGTLTGWLHMLENNSHFWNLTNILPVLELFQAERDDFVEALYLLPDVFSLLEQLPHNSNITDAIIEVFTFMLSQETNMSIYGKEDLSSKANGLLKLLELVTNMPDESAKVLSCLSTVACWNLTTANLLDDPALKPCNLDSSFVYNMVADAFELLQLTAPAGNSLCSNEELLREASYNMTCFFYQLKEWNSFFLKFSEIHHLDDDVLMDLEEFWDDLSVSLMSSGNSSLHSIHCPSTPKRQAALQLIEVVNNMTTADIGKARAVSDQLADLHSFLRLNGSAGTSVINTILTNLKIMVNDITGMLDSEDVLSFLSAAQPLMALSPAGNQTYVVFMALATLSRNSSSLFDNFEALWLDTEKSIWDLLVNFDVSHLLSVIEKEIQLLSTATGQNSSLALGSFIKWFNLSSLETIITIVEGLQEIERDWLNEYTHKNYSRIINALVLLMANENSSDDLIAIIKDIIDFLEVFQNGSRDYFNISFVTDLLNEEKLNNVHVAHLILQNNMLNMISDFVTEEEIMHLNSTDLQIEDFIDLFFNNTQYENYRKNTAPFQSRIMEMVKVLQQIFFPSSAEYYRNKIIVLLKDLHRDIMAEMSIFPRDKILTLLNLDWLIKLQEEVDGLKENIIYSSFKEHLYDPLKAISEDKTLHFDSAKGLKFVKDLFNVLFGESAEKNGTQDNYELFHFMNNFNADNSWKLVQMTRELSTSLRIMRQTFAKMGKIVDIFTSNHSKDFPDFYSPFWEMDLVSLAEQLISLDKVFPLKNKEVEEATKILLFLISWSSSTNYTHGPFSETADYLSTLLQESDEFAKLSEVVEAIAKFLAWSKKASEKIVTIFEQPTDLDTTENVDYLHVFYPVLQRAVCDAVNELTTSETAEAVCSNEKHVADLVKAFLDLTYLSIQVDHSSSNGSETVNTSTRLPANLSKLSELNNIVGEIAAFLADVQNYSWVLERLVTVVTNANINSPNKTVSLIQYLLCIFVPINDITSKIALASTLNLTHNPTQEEKWGEIQEMIANLHTKKCTSIKPFIRAVADLLLGGFWENKLNENDLNLLLTYANNHNGFLRVMEIIMELFNLTNNVSERNFSLRSFFSSLINQNIRYLQKKQSSWKTVIKGSLNEIPWVELLHLDNNQPVNSTRTLVKTLLGPFIMGITGVADTDQLQKNAQGLIHGFKWMLKQLSSYEKYAQQLISLTEYWQQGPLNDQRVISNLLCAFTSCKNGLTKHLLRSVIEGISLIHDQYQDIEKTWPVSNQGDCENIVNINKKFSGTLHSFLRTLQNTTDSSCECQLILEDIQKHVQILAENLEASLSGNSVPTFLSNFSLPNDVKIKDFVQNITELTLQLHSSVNISEETIDIILEGSGSHSKFFYSVLAVALAGRCDKEVLSLLLMLPGNDKTSQAVKELCALPALDLYTMIVLIAQNLNLRNIIYKVKIPSEVDNLLNTLLDLVSSISSLLNKAQHVMENLPMFFQAFRNMSLLDISIFHQVNGGQSRSSAIGSLQSVIKAVCKEDSSFFSNANMFIDMPRITELLEEDMAKYSIPKDSTPFCLQLYQEILQSTNGALLWTFLKPLLHGKILYTSNIKKINLVIEKFLLQNIVEALQNSFIKNFVESHLNLDVGKFVGKLRIYEAMMDKMLNNSVTEQIDLLSQLVINISSCVLLDRFQPLESVEKLEAKAYELMQQNNFLAIIFLVVMFDKEDYLPPHISYTVRSSVLFSMRTDLIKNPLWKFHPQNLPADGFKYNHIFIPLQDVIESAIVSVHAATDASEPEIQVQAMPYPCHTSDLFLNNIGFFFPLIMMLTWMVSVAGMVRKLVYEREICLEEYMKTMGVHPSIHFLAWFLENIAVLAISSCTLVIILKVSGIFAYSNSFLIFLFFLDFGVAVVMLSYLMGAFFSSANTAALSASLVYMISFLPYIVLFVLQNQLSFANQIIACLLSTTAFGQGVFFITFFEGQEIGIQWSNMYQTLPQGGSITFGWACWMIFFDSIMCFIAGWYFSNTIPGRFGLREPWYFPLSVSYWKNFCSTDRRNKPLTYGKLFFQKITSEEGIAQGVVLISLTKEYTQSKKTAVKDLSLTFYRDQITALLGPNGAGKTTVISMLTGLSPPSSGTIIINGRDMRTHLPAVRLEIGVCPQHDVLFDMLTVQEHLLLYGSVKASHWTKKQLNQQVFRALKDVSLSEHKDKLVGTLSGGMKRKLSIAIAFIGNSRTVILDEPTSGIDPCSRRSIWDILLKYRAGRTLVFTTHHLDEAEVLSDRIAILQHGQLHCCDSPSYLKEKYGQGYSLTLIKKPSMFEIQDPKDTVRVTSLVQSHLPEAFLKENSGSELTYLIPRVADKASFKGLFQALDENLLHLHVTGYGISDTTLEQVFLKKGFLFVKRCVCLMADSSLMDAQTVHGASLALTQIAALLLKRFHHTRRNWRGTLSNVLLPVLFVTMAMALFTVKPLAIDYPSLKLTPGLYDNAESFFRKNDLCWQTEPSSPQKILDSCGCKCPIINISVPYLKNMQGHLLYNLSGFNVEEYLIRPSNKARYGGWTFGVKIHPELQGVKPNWTNSKPLAKVWYNQKGFHSLPSYLNQLNNLILWMNLPSNVDWRQYGITLYSHPYGGALLDEDKIMENIRQCGVALCIMLGFSLLTASIGSSIVKDRESGAKRLQHLTGLGYKTYWLGNFLYDMLFYLVPVILCVGVITAFQLSAFTFRQNLAATALLLILFGYAALPWMYFVSRFFSSSDVAFISYISLNFVFGLCTMLVTLLPRLLAIITKTQNLYSIFKWAFIVFPQFCLGQGLIELSYNQIKFDLTSNFGIDSYVSPFEMNFLGWIFVEMALQGTVLLLLRVFLHWDLMQKPRGHCSISSTVNPSEDIDVAMERKRVFGGRTSNDNDVLLLYNLKKLYHGFSRRSTAVKDISLGIPRGECFGLLGTNGAGKSTTFKMLTGDITPTAGCAMVRTPTGSEIDILSAISKGILIGYCPQQDALDELLTGWEHLYYYCRLRGVPTQCIHKVAGDLVSQLHLDTHIDKLVRTYSGGTRRKLSAALALVGKPQILLLDEPSSGMDPCSKRYLWKTIMKEVQDGCAAVLTSHSMEECEALCTRLAIMVDGSFQCLGSPQHIKNRFGDGYSVKVWLNKETSYQSAILDCLQLHFPGTQFKGQHLNLLEYDVPRRWGYLAELFKVLENHKLLFQIKHYSIGQTTLEQVFLNFAKHQQETSRSAQDSSTSHHYCLPV
uniref:ATP binding cassette subfamily A member 13 n=1 Tax=Crocodylus porosus TaxID=8502 RepID=A0A7M4FCZ6_CROPO